MERALCIDYTTRVGVSLERFVQWIPPQLNLKSSLSIVSAYTSLPEPKRHSITRGAWVDAGCEELGMSLPGTLITRRPVGPEVP